MSLANHIIAAWLPKSSGTGALHTDVGPTQTHMQWVSPSTERWRATEAGWTPRITASGDYLLSSKVPVDVSQSPWAIVHWVKRLGTGTSYANSFDGSHNISAFDGPRHEFQSRAWGYSTPSGPSVYLSAGTDAAIGVWGLYGLTHDGSTTAKTYNQGQPTGATGTGAFVGVFPAVALGRGPINRQIDGLLGGTVILSRQLTDTEWRQVYNAGPACEWVYRKRRRVYSIPAGPSFQSAWATRATTIAGVLQ